ncbi:MAG: peroxiredoxin [Bacteroidota bacterium]
MALKTGDTAPGFTLVDTDRNPRSLKDFAGRKTVLAFYPGAFTGVCTKEMCALRDAMSVLNTLQAQVVGISVDSPFANKAFAEQNRLTFPLLSDHTREVSRTYGGVHADFAGVKGYEVSKRAVYVLDAKGAIRLAWVTENPGVEPDYAEIRRLLESI